MLPEHDSQLSASYDVHTGQFWGYSRRRKRAREFLSFLKSIRRKPWRHMIKEVRVFWTKGA